MTTRSRTQDEQRHNSAHMEATRTHAALLAACNEYDRLQDKFGRQHRDVLLARRRVQYERKARLRSFEACAEELAQGRGWVVGKNPFLIPQLQRGSNGLRRDDGRGYDGRMFDHCQYFRGRGPLWLPVAILSHSYNTDFNAHVQKAEELNLSAEALPFSWYYPGATLAVLYTRREES